MGDDPKQLNWNSISGLTIKNLVVNSRKEHVSVSLRRCEAVQEEGEIFLIRLDDEPPDSTAFPSQLFELELSIVDELGYGRSGTAFSISLESLWECTDENSSLIKLPRLPYLPSLVLKVANESSFRRLAREALNYRVLGPLRGLAIPRYYGWFNLTLDDGLSYPGAESLEGHRILSVLLMEQMGEHLDLKETQEEIDDIKDMLYDIARFNVEHNDVRFNNLLRAPSSPPRLPGEICEFHRRQHKFRVIDLEAAKPWSETHRHDIGYDLLIQLKEIYGPRKIE